MISSPSHREPSSLSPSANLRLEVVGIGKSFGATQALRKVDLRLGAGEVHAVIGENGAGKSTLMKILSGACQSDRGSIRLDGAVFEPGDPLNARRAGVAMIYQELNLAPHLSVEENILLGDEPHRLGWLCKGERRAAARKALAELQHDTLDLDRPVIECTIAEQQIVEIARALVREPKVLILDEPTSSLTQLDTRRLFAAIQRLRSRGVSILYISHFLEECREICDRFTVLRDGESVVSGAMADTDVNQIIRAMVGREVSEIYPRSEHAMGEPVLKLDQLAGRVKPRRCSLTLRAGEIMGIAGLIGSGRTEMVRACFGLDSRKSGRVHVHTREVETSHPAVSLANGMGLLSENRKEEGLLLNRSIADNLAMTRYAPVMTLGLIRGRQLSVLAKDWMTRLRIKAERPDQKVGELSGGNQQKVCLARLLHHEADIFLLDEPTRGIDVGSKAEIYRLMDELARQGKAVLFISSYLPELLGVCDSIAVMNRGVLSAVRPVGEWTEHRIIEEAIRETDE